MAEFLAADNLSAVAGRLNHQKGISLPYCQDCSTPQGEVGHTPAAAEAEAEAGSILDGWYGMQSLELPGWSTLPADGRPVSATHQTEFAVAAVAAATSF